MSTTFHEPHNPVDDQGEWDPNIGQDSLLDVAAEAVRTGDEKPLLEWVEHEAAVNRSEVAATVLGFIINDANPLLASYCVAIACASASFSKSRAWVSRQCGVTRSAVTQRIDRIVDDLHLQPRDSRSASIRSAHSAAKTRDHYQRRSLDDYEQDSNS